jgi:hypothetical protein
MKNEQAISSAPVVEQNYFPAIISLILALVGQAFMTSQTPNL